MFDSVLSVYLSK